MPASRTKLKQVLFLCTANYYRSRLSELLFNSLAEERGLHWRADSRGFRTWMAEGQGPISCYTVERLTARGIAVDLNRFPRPLTRDDLESSDLVVAVKEAEHRAMMAEQFPDWVDRVEYWHVDDLDCATPDEALPLCEKCIEDLVERLAAMDGAASRRKTTAGLRQAG